MWPHTHTHCNQQPPASQPLTPLINHHKKQATKPQPVFKLGAKSATCYVKPTKNKKKNQATTNATRLAEAEAALRLRLRLRWRLLKSALNFDFIWRLTYLASKAEPVRPSSDVDGDANIDIDVWLVSDATERQCVALLCSQAPIHTHTL